MEGKKNPLLLGLIAVTSHKNWQIHIPKGFFSLIKYSRNFLPFEMKPLFFSSTCLQNKHAVKILNVSNYLNIKNNIKLLFVLLECTHISNLNLLYLVILIIFELEVV